MQFNVTEFARAGKFDTFDAGESFGNKHIGIQWDVYNKRAIAPKTCI